MWGNTIGKMFRFTSFGESHGKSVGGVIDGCPSGIDMDFERIGYELSRRKPQSRFSTTRMEDDVVNIVSGVFEGKTLGTPIMFYVENRAQRSEDYDVLKDAFRPSHADYTYTQKYGFSVVEAISVIFPFSINSKSDCCCFLLKYCISSR